MDRMEFAPPALAVGMIPNGFPLFRSDSAVFDSRGDFPRSKESDADSVRVGMGQPRSPQDGRNWNPAERQGCAAKAPGGFSAPNPDRQQIFPFFYRNVKRMIFRIEDHFIIAVFPGGAAALSVRPGFEPPVHADSDQSDAVCRSVELIV